MKFRFTNKHDTVDIFELKPGDWYQHKLGEGEDLYYVSKGYDGRHYSTNMTTGFTETFVDEVAFDGSRHVYKLVHVLSNFTAEE